MTGSNHVDCTRHGVMHYLKESVDARSDPTQVLSVHDYAEVVYLLDSDVYSQCKPLIEASEKTAWLIQNVGKGSKHKCFYWDTYPHYRYLHVSSTDTVERLRKICLRYSRNFT